MKLVFSSFFRAFGDCFHKTVLLWTLLPVAVLALSTIIVAMTLWEPALDWASAWIGGMSWMQPFWRWLESFNIAWGATALASALLVLFGMAALVVLVIFVASVTMTPKLVSWVAARKFAHLEKKMGASTTQSVLFALGSTCLALLVLVLSIPLWFVPPMMLIIPALIWGWLTYRTMGYDALAEHASEEERKALMKKHQVNFLVIGIGCGLLGAAPSVAWASGVLFIALFWILVPLAIWIYALVLAFSALWFAHFSLMALEQLRSEQQ